jgi:hypothetical protein
VDEAGLVAEEYSAAILRGTSAAALLEQLIAGVRAAVLRREQRTAERVFLVRPFWADIPEDRGPNGVTLVDWEELAIATVPGPPPDFLACFGAWDVEVVGWPHREVLKDATPPRKTRRGPPALGDKLARWLSKVLATSGRRGGVLTRISRPGIPRGNQVFPDAWIHLAIEALLHNYQWGPDLAWRRLVAEWQDRVPESRGKSVDRRAADDYLHACLAELGRRIARRVTPARDRLGRRPTCLVVAPICDHPPAADAIRAALADEGVEACCVSVPWLERLGDRVAVETWLLHDRSPIEDLDGRPGPFHHISDLLPDPGADRRPGDTALLTPWEDLRCSSRPAGST